MLIRAVSFSYLFKEWNHLKIYSEGKNTRIASEMKSSLAILIVFAFFGVLRSNKTPAHGNKFDRNGDGVHTGRLIFSQVVSVWIDLVYSNQLIPISTDFPSWIAHARSQWADNKCKFDNIEINIKKFTSEMIILFSIIFFSSI